jgi:uncharacterized protein YaaQ
MSMSKVSNIDMLVLVETPGTQSDVLMHELRDGKYYFTIINSTSGIIQESIHTMLIGINHARITDLKRIVHDCCQSHTQFIPTQTRISYIPDNLPMVEANIGGATIYTLEVEKFIQI